MNQNPSWNESNLTERRSTCFAGNFKITSWYQSCFWDLLRHPSLVFLYKWQSVLLHLSRYLDTIGVPWVFKRTVLKLFCHEMPRKMIQNNTNLSRCISSFLFQSDVDIKHRWRRTWGREQILKGFLITQILTRNFSKEFRTKSFRLYHLKFKNDLVTETMQPKFSSKRLWSNYWHFLSCRESRKSFNPSYPPPKNIKHWTKNIKQWDWKERDAF